MENNFNLEELTKIVTEKFGALSESDFNVDSDEFSESKLTEQFEDLTSQLQSAIINENKTTIVLGVMNNSTNNFKTIREIHGTNRITF